MDNYKARTRNLFDPKAPSFKFSRSALDMFIRCPRCFYLDRKLGIGRPDTPPFSLNSAVDKLLKKEFDIHRAKNKAHPLMKKYRLKAVPFAHEKLNEWRENFKGITYPLPHTNFMVTGAVDDVWINTKGELIIVDYKATAKTAEVTLDAEWQDGYKRQMEIYQWLFRKNGFPVSRTGYFVYCNGNLDDKAFDGKLNFRIKLIPYRGSTLWVEGALRQAHKLLMGKRIPTRSEKCDYCLYTQAVEKFS